MRLREGTGKGKIRKPDNFDRIMPDSFTARLVNALIDGQGFEYRLKKQRREGLRQRVVENQFCFKSERGALKLNSVEQRQQQQQQQQQQQRQQRQQQHVTSPTARRITPKISTKKFGPKLFQRVRVNPLLAEISHNKTPLVIDVKIVCSIGTKHGQ